MNNGCLFVQGKDDAVAKSVLAQEASVMGAAAEAGTRRGDETMVLRCGKTVFFEPFLYKNRSFYQDGLGTNIGKTQKKGRFLEGEKHTAFCANSFGCF